MNFQIGDGHDIGLYGDRYTPEEELNSIRIGTYGWLSFAYSFIDVIPSTVYAYYTVLPVTVINTSDLVVDFTRTPRIGASPLTVDFVATVTLAGGASGTMMVKEYHWYFDYENNPTSYVVSTTPNITNVYVGYYGQQFSVKLCIILN